MKQHIQSICLTAMVAVTVSLCTSSPANAETFRQRVDFDAGNARIDTVFHSSGEKFVEVNFPETLNTAEESEPMLPMKYVTFRVPVYTNNFKVSVTGCEYSGSVSLGVPLRPCEHLTTNQVFEGYKGDVRFGEAYKLSRKSPAATVCDEFFLNGCEHYVRVAVCPVGYDAPASELNLYSQVEFDLSFDKCGAGEMAFTPIFSGKSQHMFDAGEYTDLTAGESADIKKAVARAQTETSDDFMYYVIIVPESLKDAVSRLRDWKKQKGYGVTVKTVESILSDPNFRIGAKPEYVDKEASVRAWMQDFYTHVGKFHCLIVGDYRTSAPIRKYKAFYGARGETNDPYNPNSDLYSPSDMYFSDLTTTFKLENSEIGIKIVDVRSRTISFSPSINVGRLLCFTPKDIDQFVDKLILYELYPGKGDTEYLNHGFLGVHSDLKAYCKSNNIFINALNMQIDTIISDYPSEIKNPKTQVKDIQAKLNISGLNSLQYHGSPIDLTIVSADTLTSSWPPYKFLVAKNSYRFLSRVYHEDDNNGLDLISNINKPSIAYSQACTIAPFDNLFSSKLDEIPDEDKYTFSGSYTVGGNYGGPVILANTRAGIIGSSGAIERLFGIALSTNRCIGMAENLSKLNYSNINLTVRHNVIGDPELNVWLKSPSVPKYNAIINNEALIISCGLFNKGKYGLTYGAYNLYKDYVTNDYKIEIPLKNIISTHTESRIGSLWISQDDMLPVNVIFTSGNKLTNRTESYVVRDLELKYHDPITTGVSIPDYKPYFNLGKKADLSIYSFKDIKSDGGILMDSGSKLSLTSETKVSLSNDVLKSGASLEIKAGQTVLNRGVSIEKGATLMIK